jgi:hypothetical protein
MTSSIDFDKIDNIKSNFGVITKISAQKVNILNLSVLDKFINLQSLYIVECELTCDDLINYDYSKFVKLKELVFIGNSPKKKYFDIGELAKVINENADLDNFDYAYSIALGAANNQLIYTIGKYINYEWDIKFQETLKNSYNKTEIKEFATWDIFMGKYAIISKIITDYEKIIYNENYETESRLPINNNIFKLGLDNLILPYYNVNVFFNLLPENSPLMHTLKNLSFKYSSYQSWHQTKFCSTFEFYQYLYLKIKNDKIKVDLSNDNIIIDNEPICKLLLLKKINTKIILKYFALDMHEFFKIDKNQAFVKLNEKCYNLVLYKNKQCYCANFINSLITFKSGITDLYMRVIGYQHLGYSNTEGEKLLSVGNLPIELQRLNIVFINEYHDNYHSDASSSDYLLDYNLPSTLEEINLVNVSEEMIKNIKKIPFNCVIKHKVFDENKYTTDFYAQSEII